jgi:hypothetical protein
MKRLLSLSLAIIISSAFLSGSLSFELHHGSSRATRFIAGARRAPTPTYFMNRNENDDDNDNDNYNRVSKGVEEYRNPVTQILSNFMGKPDSAANNDNNEDAGELLAEIDFAAPKLKRKLSLERLAAVLDAELYDSEWFVTGKVNPIYFADSFCFQDPDVKLDGIEAYARGVNKLFDQVTSRAEIISTVVNTTVPYTLTCTWRLSGKVDVGPGLNIKPYLVFTDFTVDPDSGLILFQEDRFAIPQWDILLSALFPFLIGKVTSPPAPPVEPRVVPMPKLDKAGNGSPFDMLQQFLSGGKTQ